MESVLVLLLPEAEALTGAAAAALRRMPPPAQVNPVLLHGDFWPGDILWRDRRLVAVIDWEDASIGDPLVDRGVSRLELLGPARILPARAQVLDSRSG